MKLSLRGKINLIISLVLLVAFSTVAGMFLYFQSRQQAVIFERIKSLQQVVAQSGTADLQNALFYFDDHEKGSSMQQSMKERLIGIAESKAKVAETGGVLIYDKKGTILAASRADGTPPATREALRELEQDSKGRHRIRTVNGERLVSFYFPISAAGKLVGTVEVISSLAEFDRQVTVTWWVLLGAAILAIGGMTFLVGALLSRFVIRPIRATARMARDIAEGEGDRAKGWSEGDSGAGGG